LDNPRSSSRDVQHGRLLSSSGRKGPIFSPASGIPLVKVGIIFLDFTFVEEKENVALLKSGWALFDSSVDVLGCILAI
jgi:hypothetical protein